MCAASTRRALRTRRAHGRSDYPATGAHLATCRRIVEREIGNLRSIVISTRTWSRRISVAYQRLHGTAACQSDQCALNRKSACVMGNRKSRSKLPAAQTRFLLNACLPQRPRRCRRNAGWPWCCDWRGCPGITEGACYPCVRSKQDCAFKTQSWRYGASPSARIICRLDRA